MTTQGISHLWRDFIRTEAGATGIEYALIAGGISITIAAGVHGINDATSESFQNVSDGLAANNTP